MVMMNRGFNPMVSTLIKNSQALAARQQPKAPVYSAPAPNPNVISTTTNYRPTPQAAQQAVSDAAKAALFRGRFF